MTTLPGIGAATRFGVSRTFAVTAALARAAVPEGREREALRARAEDALGELWEGALDAVLRTRLLDRTAERLLSEGVVERLTTLALEHPATEGVVARLVESPAFDRLVVSIVESPGFERLVVRVVESPGFERLLLDIVHSKLFEEMLDRALVSEQLDRVVAQIAESEEVHDALRQQSAGMADEVTDELRLRTMAADALLERIARSMIRRRPAQPGGPAGATP